MADIFGTQNNDRLNGTWEDDSIYGYEGNDKLYGKGGNDWLEGGDGKDYLEGGSGDDSLWGGYGKDELRGGSGYDYLYGDYGDDVLRGGDDADTFAFYSWDEGIDKIKDFSSHEGDKVQVFSSGFGIGTSDLHRFSFDDHTGALSFDHQQFATLQPHSGFDIHNDLSIV